MAVDHPDFRATRDRRIHASVADSVERFAERLRDSGADREVARRVATEAAEHMARDLDKGSGQVMAGRGGRSPFRVRFQWEAEDAGISLDDEPASDRG